jgi:hypothetical protein
VGNASPLNRYIHIDLKGAARLDFSNKTLGLKKMLSTTLRTVRARQSGGCNGSKPEAQELSVSVTTVYNKLQGIEVSVS